MSESSVTQTTTIRGPTAPETADGPGTVGAAIESADHNPQLTEERLFSVLSNRRRRFALHALAGCDGSTSLGALAEQIAAWENGVDVDQVTGAERKRVYTALQQSHLPKIHDAGIVRFDKDRGTVEPTDALAEVDVYLDVVRDDDIPWSEYYLGLSGVASVLFAALWLDVAPFVMLPDLAWGVVITLAFAVSALVHRSRSREMKLGDSPEPPEVARR